jgi:hypothetical protein
MRTPLIMVLILSGVIMLFQKSTDAEDCRGPKILSVKSCDGDELENEERKLYQMISQYRAEYRLSSIPSSLSLNLVANRHVRDVADNFDRISRKGQHWLHGWSDCSYDANDTHTLPCMWEAPKRLRTPYPGIGFEIFCGNPDAKYQKFIMTADYAFNTWKKSSHHRDVILNRGKWQKYKWNAIGTGIYKGYAALWFGAEPDPLGSGKKK